MKRTLIIVLSAFWGICGMAQNELPGINEYIFAEQAAKPTNLSEVSQLVGYPEEAKNAGKEGQVIARVLVDEEGKYMKHKIVRLIDSSLAAAVEKHVSKLNFTPAIQEGKAIKFWVNVPFTFMLQAIDPRQQAIDNYTKYLEENPDSYEAYMQRGVSYMDLEDYDKAMADLDKSIELNPRENKNDPEKNSYGFLYYATYAKGKSYASRGEWQNCINTLNEALKLSEEIKIEDSTITSTLPSLFADRGFAYINLNQLDNGIADYDKSIALSPKLACSVHQLRAEACLTSNDFANVIKSYNALIECQPEDRFLHYSRGFYKMELGDYEGAVADFRETVSRNTDVNIKLAAINSTSLALLKSGKTEDALAEIEKAIKINALYAPSHYYRGNIYKDKGENEKACEDYQNAIDFGLEDSMPDEAKEVEKFIEDNCK